MSSVWENGNKINLPHEKKKIQTEEKKLKRDKSSQMVIFRERQVRRIDELSVHYKLYVYIIYIAIYGENVKGKTVDVRPPAVFLIKLSTV